MKDNDVNKTNNSISISEKLNDTMMKIEMQMEHLNDNLSKKSAANTAPGSGKFYLFGSAASSKVNKQEYEWYCCILNHTRKALIDFGIHTGNCGFLYIIDAVMIIIDRNCMNIQLCNDIYPLIAEKYDYKKPSAIAHDIRNAITAACKDYARDNSANKMGLFRGKTTNKEFILYITEYVWRKASMSTLAVKC